MESPIKIMTADGFSVGDLVDCGGIAGVVVDFIKDTDRWGMELPGYAALLYTGHFSLSRIPTYCLKRAETK